MVVESKNMGAGASASGTLQDELDKPLDGSDLTPETALAEVKRLRALLAASVSVPSPPPLVICGPSGVGKGTLLEYLMKKLPQFTFSVSHTTRSPRTGETDGVHYHFSDTETVKSMIEKGEFLEYAEVHGNYYGTSYSSLQSDSIAVLDIDVQGVKKVKKAVEEGKLGAAKYIFIAPVSLEVLEARLRGRGTETEEKIQLRTANAKAEMEYGSGEGNFDFTIVNDDLKKAQEEITNVVTDMYSLVSP